MDTIYLDYHKAFDTVLFRRHTHKLKAYGISGSLLAWITSFLTGRTQRVRVNGDLSDPQPVISGVPQSSVLGPLFCFLVSFPAAFCPLAMCSTLFLDDLVLPIRAGIVILLVRPFHWYFWDPEALTHHCYFHEGQRDTLIQYSYSYKVNSRVDMTTLWHKFISVVVVHLAESEERPRHFLPG